MPGMRDVVVHQYFGIEVKTFWNAATVSVPNVLKVSDFHSNHGHPQSAGLHPSRRSVFHEQKCLKGIDTFRIDASFLVERCDCVRTARQHFSQITRTPVSEHDQEVPCADDSLTVDVSQCAELTPMREDE